MIGYDLQMLSDAAPRLRQSCPLQRAIGPLLFLLLFLIQPAAGLAEYIEPGDVQVKTERYEPEETDFAAGTYKYSVSWQGIPVAEAAIEVKSNEDESDRAVYDVTAKAQTGDVISVFYRLTHRSNSVFDASSLQPVRFESAETERRRQKKREVRFKPDGTIEFVYSKNGKVNTESAFHSSNFTLDPISAAFVARSLPIDLGTTASFDVFNGKHRYLITCTVEGRETIEVAGRSYPAFRVVPKVQKLTDSDRDDRLQSAIIWISADNARHVLRVESKVWVGSVTAELTAFHPEAAKNPEAIRASLGRIQPPEKK